MSRTGYVYTVKHIDHRMMADIFQFRSPTLATTFYALVNVLNIISKGTVNVALCKSCTFFHKLIKTNDNFFENNVLDSI